MRGRLMAGSQALIAPDATGHAVCVASQPPDLPLSPVMVASCQQGALATGRARFVIARAGNSLAMACAFAQQGWGWLGRRDDNEHEGLASLAATEVAPLADGTRV
jgi:hypothetical protein